MPSRCRGEPIHRRWECGRPLHGRKCTSVGRGDRVARVAFLRRPADCTDAMSASSPSLRHS